LRKFLLKIFNQSFGQDAVVLEIVNGFSAYDRRWIDQPDHEKRLSVFRKLDSLMESQEVSVDLGVLVVYHCFHYLRYEKDLALRDNASHYLKLVTVNVVNNNCEDRVALDYFLDKVVLNLVQRGIKDQKIRNEAILFLGELARKCRDVHPVLDDLYPLTNEKVRDLDFFDNITHLQKFRHMKGLRKFNQVAGTLEKTPNLRTMIDFLIPISRIFLCSEDYRRKSKIIEAATEFVANICRFLPWAQYETILKFYLRKMSTDSLYQKQLIRLIPAILDAFHFDISGGLEAGQEVVVKEPEVEELVAENEEDELEFPDEPTEILQQMPIESITKLKPSLAKRVVNSLSRRLIPALFKIINEQISYDKAHKLNKEDRRAKEKSDMLRIPIALPVVKLLQKLPKKFLDENFSLILYKVCSFLRSTLKQVRATARFTLNEIVACLGPESLEKVLSHLNSLLSKGFQVRFYFLYFCIFKNFGFSGLSNKISKIQNLKKKKKTN
jgi:U3 small nucleolar RNA-associated protein 20